jgi:hypothetical protein
MGIKHLIQENPNMEINLIRLLSKLDPSKSNKFTPFLLKIVKEKIETFNKEFNGNGPYGNRYVYLNETISGVDGIEKLLIMWIIDHMFQPENIEILVEFNEALQKGLVVENDISKYKNMNEITNQLSIARTKDLLNKSRKEISVVYEDDMVMMLKPLSFEASLKYGAGTKWCTAMKSDPEYFYRYSKNGILIYLINKVTGRKFGCFSEVMSRVSIFNEVDESIDSFHMELPYETLSKLMGFLDTSLHKSNVHLFSDEEMVNHNKYFGQKVARNYDELIPNELIPMEDRAIMEDGMEEIIEPQVDVDNIGLRLRPIMRVVRRDMEQEEIGININIEGGKVVTTYDNDSDSEPIVEEEDMRG